MKKTIFMLILLALNASAMAWDFSSKGNIQTVKTNNVNLTTTSPIADTYLLFGGYIQAKNDNLKFKLKAKNEKYKDQKTNDNYSADLGVQYKANNSEYNFGVFNQVYNGATLTSSDTTSDNSGARVSATFTHKYTNETSEYFTINGSYKKYPNITDRIDKAVGLSYGLEHNFTSQISINPEINITNNSSGASYYSYFSYGPFVILSYIPNDSWEFFVDANITRTNYSDRTIITNSSSRLRSGTTKEYQSLLTTDIGALYNLSQYFTIQVKYSKSKNSSNNETAPYTANVLAFDLSLRI